MEPAGQRIVVRSARVLTPLETIANGGVLITGGQIEAVGPVPALATRGARVLDCGDCTIVPGFLDLHLHGSGGASVMDGPAALARVASTIVRSGVTGWLPTLTPRATIGDLAERIAACRAAATSPATGAAVLGIHLEGPFLNPKRPGALRAEWFQPPSEAELAALLAAGKGAVRLMTLAPERPGGLALVRQLVAAGVVASLGHTDASAAEASEAIAAGVRYATHTYNAMRPFHHRDGGTLGAVFAAEAVYAELIADGVHVSASAASLLLHRKTPHRTIAITDAVAPAGLGDGLFDFEGRPITVRDGRATLADGTIAGSVASFDGNLRWLVQAVGLSLPAAVTMATLTPARAIGLGHCKGYLGGGRDADLVALDRELRVRLTMVQGQVRYTDGLSIRS
jgi:N-acetylglucosamine-6-phosphate deacetylase